MLAAAGHIRKHSGSAAGIAHLSCSQHVDPVAIVGHSDIGVWQALRAAEWPSCSHMEGRCAEGVRYFDCMCRSLMQLMADVPRLRRARSEARSARWGSSWTNHFLQRLSHASRARRCSAARSVLIRAMAPVDQSFGTVDPRVLFQRGGTTLQQIPCSPCESEIIAKSDLVEGQGQSRFVTPEIGKPSIRAGQRGVESFR